MRISVLLSASLYVLVGASCVSSTGRLEQNRFQHETYPYALFYPASGRPDAPLGPHYKLENFRSPDGRHRYQKAGDGYTIPRRYDEDAPPHVERELFYDLLLSREAPEAAFWIRSVPLSQADRALPLNELARQYLDRAARLGRVAVPMGVEAMPDTDARAKVHETARIPCELSKREALRIDFELATGGATRSAGAATKAGSVVLVRSGYLARGKYPVLMLVGRSSKAADSAPLERDFDRLLEQLVLGDEGQGLSMKGGHTCRPSAGDDLVEGEASPSSPPTSGGESSTPVLEVPIIDEDASSSPGGGEFAPSTLDAP